MRPKKGTFRAVWSQAVFLSSGGGSLVAIEVPLHCLFCAFFLTLVLVLFLSFFVLKSLLHLLQYCFCFMFWFFGHKACGILAPWPGIKPTPPALEGEVLTTGPPGKSLWFWFLAKPTFNCHSHFISPRVAASLGGWSLSSDCWFLSGVRQQSRVSVWLTRESGCLFMYVYNIHLPQN